MSDIKNELATQAAFGTPPVTVTVMTTIGGITLNEWVGLATLVYLAAQIGYLLWKWRRDWLKSRVTP